MKPLHVKLARAAEEAEALIRVKNHAVALALDVLDEDADLPALRKAAGILLTRVDLLTDVEEQDA